MTSLHSWYYKHRHRAVATVLLVFEPGLVTLLLLVSFALYAPWVWGRAV